MKVVESAYRETFFFLAAFIFAVFFISSDLLEGLKVYDEGVTVYGATRILQGDIPFRDFWTAYMPGHFYLYALIFKLFGVSLLAERITSAVLMLGICVMIYLIARKLMPWKYALGAFIFSVSFLASFKFFGYIMHPTLLLGLGSFYCFLRYIIYKTERNLLWAGVFAGATAIFRHDFGFYVFCLEMLSLLLYTLVYVRLTGQEKKRLMIRNCIYLIVGTAAIFIPVAAYFLVKVPFHTLYEELIVYPSSIYPDYREIPFPSPLVAYEEWANNTQSAGIGAYVKENLDRLYLYFPPIVYFALALQLIIKTRRNSKYYLTREFWITISLLALGILFFTKVLIRSVYLHLMPTYLIAIIVFFLVVHNIPSVLNNKIINRVALIALLLLAIPTLVRPLWGEVVDLFSHKKMVALKIERGRHIYWDQRGKDYQQVLNYVKATVPKSAKIYVGSIRHDRIFTNDVMFYFLSERDAPTEYHELHPGVATTEKVQKEIVHDLEAAHVNCVILTDETRVETENRSGLSSGVTLLDDYIRSHFELKHKIGPYSIWERKHFTSNLLKLSDYI